MALIQVVAIKRAYMKSTASLVKVGDIVKLDEADLRKDAAGKLLFNKDGTLSGFKWAKPAPDALVAKRQSQEAKDAELKRSEEAARVSSGGKAADKKAADIGKQLAG